MEIKYKRLTERDIINKKKEIIDLFKLLFIKDSDKDYIAQTYYEKMVTFCLDGSAIIFGAFDNSVLVGFHWGYEISWGNSRRIHSSFIVVNEKYQNQAIGTVLQNLLEDFALSIGITVIDTNCEVDNEQSFNYHLKQGFKIESYHMKKDLTK